MRSERSCFRTPVAYSSSPCRAVMIRDATLPRSRMEKDLENITNRYFKTTTHAKTWTRSAKALITEDHTFIELDKGMKPSHC